MWKIDKKVNYIGLKCPLPVLKARRELENMNLGQILEIIADDPASNLDFAHFCEISENELIESKKYKANLVFLIKKK